MAMGEGGLGHMDFWVCQREGFMVNAACDVQQRIAVINAYVYVCVCVCVWNLQVRNIATASAST